jgi:hypothetical protein
VPVLREHKLPAARLARQHAQHVLHAERPMTVLAHVLHAEKPMTVLAHVLHARKPMTVLAHVLHAEKPMTVLAHAGMYCAEEGLVLLCLSYPLSAGGLTLLKRTLLVTVAGAWQAAQNFQTLLIVSHFSHTLVKLTSVRSSMSSPGFKLNCSLSRPG